MPSKKRIAVILAAILVGIPVLAVGGFFALLTFDMHRVEVQAETCKSLIPAVQQFKHRAGRFPSVDVPAFFGPDFPRRRLVLGSLLIAAV
jgi:hypothetical protein